MNHAHYFRLAVRARRDRRTRHAAEVRRLRQLVAYHHDTVMTTLTWGDPCPVCVARAPTPDLLAFAERHAARQQ
jgi:hypothetical protein